MTSTHIIISPNYLLMCKIRKFVNFIDFIRIHNMYFSDTGIYDVFNITQISDEFCINYNIIQVSNIFRVIMSLYNMKLCKIF